MPMYEKNCFCLVCNDVAVTGTGSASAVVIFFHEFIPWFINLLSENLHVDK